MLYLVEFLRFVRLQNYIEPKEHNYVSIVLYKCFMCDILCYIMKSGKVDLFLFMCIETPFELKVMIR